APRLHRPRHRVRQLAIIAVFAISGMSYRIAVEERALTEHFGDAYRAYASHTKRLIPGIY
ncbi:MAG TPA: hypothetical protein VF381_07820, partial [Thermoanaerobaculia bacterium]